MFRNKILMCTERPELSSAFLLRSITLAAPSSPDTAAEILCWRLSRDFRIACLLQPPSQIFLIYQRSQEESAAAVVERISSALPVTKVDEAEETASVPLISLAAECMLRCAMIDAEWSCVGECSFVKSSFAACDERKFLYAATVRVEFDKDGNLVLIVSPEILRFSRHKISQLVGSKVLQHFENGEEITLDDHEFSTSCAILPSLYEGHVKALRRHLSDNTKHFQQVEQLWLLKHGLSLGSDYFMNIQSASSVYGNEQWLPSLMVLQGSGLSPAPQRIRASMVVHALEALVSVIRAWDFFDLGVLKFKGFSSLAIGTSLPVWENASRLSDYIPEGDGSFNIDPELLLTFDFRTPKPVFIGGVRNETLKESKAHETYTCSREIIQGHVPTRTNHDSSFKSTVDVVSHQLENAPLKRKIFKGRTTSRSLGTNANLRSSLQDGSLQPTESDNMVSQTEEGYLQSGLKGANHDENCLPNPCEDDGLRRTVKQGPDHVAAAPKKRRKNAIVNQLKNNVNESLGESDAASKVLLQQDQLDVVPKKRKKHDTTQSEKSKQDMDQPDIASNQAEHPQDTNQPEGVKKDCKQLHNAPKRRKHDINQSKNVTSNFDPSDATASKEIIALNVDPSKVTNQTKNAAPRKRRTAGANQSKVCKKDDQQSDDVASTMMLEQHTALRSEDSHKPAASASKENERAKELRKYVSPEERKQDSVVCDITHKVMDHHKGGRLHVLTVVELKAFLSSKKAKVGGKKDELIQRVAALLA